MREITLYPGESITIGDTTIKAAHPGNQLGSLLRPGTGAPVQHPPAPQMPQQVPGTAVDPAPPPCVWRGIDLAANPSTISIPADGRCAGQEFLIRGVSRAHE